MGTRYRRKATGAGIPAPAAISGAIASATRRPSTLSAISANPQHDRIAVAHGEQDAEPDHVRKLPCEVTPH